MQLVAIVDYGMCNLDSVARAIEECGGRPVVTADPAELARAERIILPGVGAFPDGMRQLHERGLVEPLRQQARQGIPLLGICLGMQLLADTGWEGSETPGLGLIGGRVRRLDPAAGERIPHVGWNELQLVRNSPLFEGLHSGADFYFVHSFHLEAKDTAAVTAWTPYCGRFASAVQRGAVYGVQFHPEKSQRLGFAVLRNFLAAPAAC